jgi:hypothetical protein
MNAGPDDTGAIASNGQTLVEHFRGYLKLSDVVERIEP